MAKKGRYARFDARQPVAGRLVMVKMNGGKPQLAQVLRNHYGYYWLLEGGKEVVAVPDDRWKPLHD